MQRCTYRLLRVLRLHRSLPDRPSTIYEIFDAKCKRLDRLASHVYRTCQSKV